MRVCGVCVCVVCVSVSVEDASLFSVLEAPRFSINGCVRSSVQLSIGSSVHLSRFHKKKLKKVFISVCKLSKTDFVSISN